MRIVLAVIVLCLAGCGSPPEPTPVAVGAPTAPADTDYRLTVRVSQETADGPVMPGVEVQAFILAERGQPALAVPRAVPASTDGQGLARFLFEEPSLVAVRATAPGWTSEGQVLRVEEAVAMHGPVVAFGGPLVSERDFFLPLFRATLDLAAATALMTSVVQPAPDGGLDPPVATADLVFPDGLGAAYLARLSAADVHVTWEDTVSSRAHVSAALAWDGAVWVRGEAPAPGLAPGPREAAYSGALPAEGRPASLAAATLQAAAVLESVSVGEVPLAFAVRLAFTGSQPPGLPAACHAMTACVPGLPGLPDRTADRAA